MRRIIIVVGLLGLTLAVMPCETEAEVAVRTDASGEYVSTVVVPGGPPWRPGIWGKRMRFGMRRDSNVLNPKGDMHGDMIPRIVEANAAPHHPWVVWSRYNGRDYDLVWSSWQRAWSRIVPVVAGSLAGDDLDADVAFGATGSVKTANLTVVTKRCLPQPLAHLGAFGAELPLFERVRPKIEQLGMECGREGHSETSSPWRMMSPHHWTSRWSNRCLMLRRMVGFLSPCLRTEFRGTSTRFPVQMAA